MGPYISEGGEMDQFLSDDFCVVLRIKNLQALGKLT
jgi:hypothetical protein